MSVLEIGGIAAAPAQKSGGYVMVATGPAHVALPVVLVNGARPGPRLCLTAGVHYGEFAGPEALLALLRALDPAALAGQVVACPLACPPAAYDHRNNVSALDGINPNRIYPGRADGKPTERLVHWLFEHLVRPSDVFIDLHSGGLSEDLVPYTGYRSSGDAALDRWTLELAELFGGPVVRGASATGGNSHAAATRAGLPALLVEVGARGSRIDAEIHAVRDGMQRVMQRLGMCADAPPAPHERPSHWRWSDEVEAPVEGFWYPAFAVGDDVAAGQLLGRIADPLGSELAQVEAPRAGRVFYGERGLPVTKGDVLAALAVRES